MLFLLIEPGGRAGAMGGAYTALANDATATYYNPAGLAQLPYGAAHRQSIRWLPSVRPALRFTHSALAFNTQRWGTLGMSETALNFGPQTYRDEAGNFQVARTNQDHVWAVSYGVERQGLLPHGALAVGVTWKRVTSRLLSLRGTAYALDVGVLVRHLFPGATFTKDPAALSPRVSTPLTHRTSRGFAVGVGLFNMGNGLVFKDLAHQLPDQRSPLPRTLRLGAAYVPIDTDLLGATLSCDLYKPLLGPFFTSEREEDLNVGAEVVFIHVLSVRMGHHVDANGDVEETTWGVGIGSEKMQFAYQKPARNAVRKNAHWSFSLAF